MQPPTTSQEDDRQKQGITDERPATVGRLTNTNKAHLEKHKSDEGAAGLSQHIKGHLVEEIADAMKDDESDELIRGSQGGGRTTPTRQEHNPHEDGNSTRPDVAASTRHLQRVHTKAFDRLEKCIDYIRSDVQNLRLSDPRNLIASGANELQNPLPEHVATAST